MPSNSKTITGLRPTKQTQEWVDKTVSATFDELFIEITSKSKLHPTEQHNREGVNLEHPFSKIYDLINSYHAFCKLCEQHFYSHSLADDVNSFFQKHINTSYHKQMRTFNPPPNDVPMFTWEEKFHTGRCNVCDMSGLNSYVLDTKFDPLKLMKLHFCVWNQENRETNEKVLRKLNLLKKFCGLTVFREMYIKTVNGRAVCLLCGLNLPWSGEKASCHLVSDHHYQKFCVLLRKCFNFAPKDALNGFNLEMIIRWLISYDPPILKEFVDYDERKICYQDSNSDENPYSDEKNNFSYSPANVEKLLENEEVDVIHKEECLLCNVPFLPGHTTSEQHKTKMMNLDEKSFDTAEKYVLYCKKRQKRLHIIDNYKSLKLGLEGTPSLKKKDKHAEQTASSQVNFLKPLFEQKLKSISITFIAANKEEVFCQICDQYLSKEQKVTHLNSMHHKTQEVKWEQLKVEFANAKFLEPFHKIEKALLCLLCGVVFNVNSFFSHLKGEMHMRKFIWYCNLNNSIPISSAIVIGTDFSCYCTLCNALLSKRVTFSSQKETLKYIKLHWPCSKIEEKEAELTGKSEAISENGNELIEKNQNAIQDIMCSTCGKTFEKNEMKSHSISCSKNSIDFKKIEKTMENIVNIFEKKIINNAFYKSAYLISRLDNSKLITTKEKIKKSLEVEGQPIAYKKTSCGCALKCLCPDGPTSESERKEEVDEQCEEVTKNEFRIQNIENNIREQKEKESTSKEEKKGESTSKEERKRECISEEEKKRECTKEEEKKREFTSEKVNKGESTSKEERKRECISEEEKKKECTSEEEKKRESTPSEEEKEDDEVIIIEGLPRNKRKLKAIYSRFSAFGKIRYVFFEAKTTVLAFNEPGVARTVAKHPNIFVNDHKVSLRVSTRKRNLQAEEKLLPSLNQDLIYLLQDPQKLMDFILNLIVQAVTALDSPVERRKEELVCSTIISAILEYFPHSRCYPFGSRLSGLMLNNSDLDVFLDCGGMYEGFKNTTPSSERKLVKNVAKLLRKKREITEMVVVDRARVPIVSFLHIPTLMRCDLSFKNGLSIQNTLLIKFMLSLDWRVRPLILFLKYWTKMNGLHGPPYFSSYAIAMLVIYYLEQLQRPVLPTIEFLQNSYVGRRTTIGGWDCSININTLSLPKSNNKDPLPKLLSGLFEFYADFDYSENIISPLTGKPLPRKAFSKSGFSKLPMCYKRHILNIPTPIENLVNSNILICVMDPFDLSHIVTKSFTFRGLQMFIGFCQKSRTYLKKGLPFSNLKQ